jgi:putative transposase
MTSISEARLPAILRREAHCPERRCRHGSPGRHPSGPSGVTPARPNAEAPAISASRLAREVGVGQPTLSKWLREAQGNIGPVKFDTPPPSPAPPRRPEDWSPEERLQAVLEASELKNEELGAFLRRKGLHETILAEWKTAALEALGPHKRSGGGTRSHAQSRGTRAGAGGRKQPEFRNLSPRQIVPRLSDRNEYIASESTFHRILREERQLAHRQHARPARRHRPKEHVAHGPNEVWSWAIMYLRSPVRGSFYYLYLIVDIWSRKIVGWSLRHEESGEHARDLIQQAIERDGADPKKLALHADNGGPMKGSTLLATVQRLGVVASFSRPGVSDDNPFSEALFRTMKYRPGFPRKPFESFAAALAWVEDFVRWYSDEHLHSAIRYVTPSDRHSGKERPLLTNRHAVYTQARSRKPRRWTGKTRNWSPVGPLYLNPSGRRSASAQSRRHSGDYFQTSILIHTATAQLDVRSHKNMHPPETEIRLRVEALILLTVATYLPNSR